MRGGGGAVKHPAAVRFGPGEGGLKSGQEGGEAGEVGIKEGEELLQLLSEKLQAIPVVVLFVVVPAKVTEAHKLAENLKGCSGHNFRSQPGNLQEHFLQQILVPLFRR